MLSSFTTRFRSFIWFVIFTFTLYSMPHLELLLPYKIYFFHSEAEASETQTAETETPATQQQTPPDALDKGTPQPQDPQKGETDSSMMSLSGSGSSELGGSSVSFKVDDFSGAAHLSYPIMVPPGRRGLAPNLSLLYNSYQGSGWVGVGWGLDMGAIQRSTKRGVNYSANDFLTIMNGSSSELLPRSDWGTNYYGNKIEGGFLKYYFNPSTGGWEVTTKEGTKYYYGTSSASRQDNAYGVFKWCLDKVQDTNGNYMTITYWKDQGEIYLDRIDWTGNGSLNPTHYIIFYLEPRSDIPLMYTTNSLVKTAYRLKSIEVYGNGLLQSKYLLDYIYSVGSTRSLLKSIT
ncbi:MAG: hypothetical protein KGZ49_12980, partial [Syntrophaceae bacterium]|nr:hypothetical protein [Syntrophaceae bacterium]